MWNPEAVARRCSVKNYSRKKKNDEKDTLAQVFSCEFCEIFKNTFITEHLQATNSRTNCNIHGSQKTNICWKIGCQPLEEDWVTLGLLNAFDGIDVTNVWSIYGTTKAYSGKL